MTQFYRILVQEQIIASLVSVHVKKMIEVIEEFSSLFFRLLQQLNLWLTVG